MGPRTSAARILHPENPSTATETPCTHSLGTGWTQRLWTRLPPAIAAHPLRMDFSELRVRHVGLTPAHTLRTLRLRGLAMPSTSASVKWALQPTSQGCCEEPVMWSESVPNLGLGTPYCAINKCLFLS